MHRLGREKLAAIDVPKVKPLIRDIEAYTRTNGRKRRLMPASSSDRAE